MRKPGTASGRWLAVLVGAALAACPVAASAVPDDPPPEGFAWQELKEIHAWILRPSGWGFRVVLPGLPFFNFSPLPFTNAYGIENGLAIHVMVRDGKSADDKAAAWIASGAARDKVLRGWTREGVPAGPFTSYGIVVVAHEEEAGGTEYICECVLIANRVTNAVYQCWLMAPTAQWKEVEATGETMLANLRLNPEF